MNIIFMGSDEFGIPALQALVESEHRVLCVVTQPDRVKKRNPLPTPTPIKETALELGIPVFQPEKLRSAEAIAYIKSIQVDLIITVSYGQIVPKEILEHAKIAAINIHASLLPKYRGAAPIHRAIMEGEVKTGVTLMHMDVGLDTGDIIGTTEIVISKTDTLGTLYEKLSFVGCELLLQHLKAIGEGTSKRTPQQHECYTYAKMLTKEEEKIDWNKTMIEIYNHIRAFNPKPGAYALFKGQPLKIWGTVTGETSICKQSPGTIVSVNKKGIEVATKDGMLLITEVQLAGKKKMDARSFANGQKEIVGVQLH